MRKLMVGAASVVALPALIAGGANAAPRVASSHGAHALKRLKVHTSKHHVCKKSYVNGMDNKGTIIFTSFCGREKTFIRSKSGHTKQYKLPRQDARITAGASMASNGILAVIGQHKPKGRPTSYLVAKNGTATPIIDPSAGTHVTQVNAVNRHGAAVGIYCENHKCTKRQSFIYRHGTFTNFTIRNPKHALPYLTGITDSGALTGFFYQYPTGYLRGFIRRHGKLHIVDAPGAGHKFGQGTLLIYASPHGAVCGEELAPHHHHSGFERRNGHNHLVALKPSAHKAFTEITGCNDRGEIALTAKLHHGIGTYIGKLG
jgi:hypothetical protein